MRQRQLVSLLLFLLLASWTKEVRSQESQQCQPNIIVQGCPGHITQQDGGQGIFALRAEIAKLNRAIGANLASDGWRRYSDESNNFWYKLHNDLSSYEEATMKCSRIGARLVTTGMRIPAIRSALISDIVRPSSNENVWIGLDDKVSKGNYVWQDGLESNEDNTDWGNNQPSNPAERCAELLRPIDYHVNDGLCRLEKAYLCELEL